MRRLALIAVLCGLAGVTPASAYGADPLDGAVVSVVATGGATPYSQVRYDVVWRNGTAVATHYRSFVNYEESLHALRLVRRSRFVQLLKTVRGMGIWALSDGPAPAVAMAGIRYEVEVAQSGKTHRFVVHDPDAQTDRRYAAIVGQVRDTVTELAGALRFRNVFFEPGTYGYLNLTSVPVAKVFIDDRDVGMETPMYGYELKAGKHVIRLQSSAEKGGYTRTHTAVVTPGMTTIIHMDLR